MRARRWRRWLWCVAFLALGVFALRTFVGDVYRVSSGSMLPTLREGEYVFVRFDRSEPRRGDIVVHERGGEAFVKRVMGLGGESVLVSRGGDLFIDGKRLAKGPRAPLIPLFDDRLQEVEDHFSMGTLSEEPWSRNEDLGGWELDARGIERDRAAGLLRLHRRAQDGYLDRDGERVYGRHHVGDLAVAFSFKTLEDPDRLTEGARVRASLVEEADTFEVTFDLDADGARVTLLRQAANERSVLDERHVAFDPAAWTEVRFENVDNVLHLSIDERTVWSLPYEHNVRNPRDTAGLGMSIGERVRVGGERCHIGLRDLRVWRDVHYLQRGSYGVGKPLALAPDQSFLLGDHSELSRDSREWGPVPAESRWGRACCVVWPPRSIRVLARPLQ